MTKRLAFYGLTEHAHLANVGTDKGKTPQSLADRMPCPEIAAKVGFFNFCGSRTRRVVRRNARG